MFFVIFSPCVFCPVVFDVTLIIYIRSLLFCCLQSLTASHSVGANVQRVLSLMKTHNMALCNGLDHQASRSSSPSSGSSSSSSIDADLAELLLQLQDEFGQMSWSVSVIERLVY